MSRKDKESQSDRRRHKKRHKDDTSSNDDGSDDDRGGDSTRRNLKEKKRHKRKESYDDEKDRHRSRSHSHRRNRHDGDDDDHKDRKRKHRSDKRSKDDADSESSSSDRRRRKKKKTHRHDHGHDHSESDSTNDKKRKDKKDKKKKKHKHKREDDNRSLKKSSSSDHKKKKNRDSSRDKNKSKDGTPKINPPDPSTLIAMGPNLGKTPKHTLDAEKDYFSYHQQFWVYLYREEGIAFNDLDTKQAHSAFRRFVQRYNKGDLEVPYYVGLPNDVIEESKTTKHSWNFKTSEQEREGLEALQIGVRKQTEYNDNKKTDMDNIQYCVPVPDSTAAARTDTVNNTSSYSRTASGSREKDRWKKTPEERQQQRMADKRLKERVQVAQEELTGIGRGDFRERQLEKKRQQSERIHGASRDKREGEEVLDDRALYGDDDRSSFQSALQRERHRDDQKRERRQNRIDELQSKEDERKNNMLKMLGLDGVKERIKIQPRNDG